MVSYTNVDVCDCVKQLFPIRLRREDLADRPVFLFLENGILDALLVAINEVVSWCEG